MRRWFSLSLCLILAYAGLAGFVSWRTFFVQVRPDYRFSFEARWIHPPRSDVNQAYFRKLVFIKSQPVAAWLAVIGRDGFTLWINGARVDGLAYQSGYAQQVFDIARYLNPGRNVLAVRNNITTYNEKPRIAVEGQYTEWNGEVTAIRSDASWRTAWRTESLTSQGGIVKPTAWFNPEFDDAAWPYVTEGEVPQETITKRLSLPRPILTTRLTSPWVWTDNSNAEEAFFRLAFDLPERPRDAWLRITAKRHHRLLVNGYLVANHESAIGTEAGPHGPLGAYNLSPFLRRGRNVVAVQAGNSRNDRGLVADGFVQRRDGGVIWFSTEGWKASDTAVEGWEAPGFDDSGWKPAVVTKPLSPVDQSSLVNERGRVRHPLFLQLKLLGLALLSIIAAVLASLLVWACSARILSALTGEPTHAVARWLALTFLPPTLVLVAVYLLGFDARLSLDFPYKPRFVWGSFGLLLLLNAVLIGGALWSRTRPAGRSLGRWHGWRDGLQRARTVDPGLLLAVGLTVVGFLLRVTDLGYEPLGGDETTAALFTQGVLERGYPSIVSEGHAKIALTSELTLWLKAPGMWLLGANAYAYRLTDVIFGTLTILLLYAVGKMCHSRRAGLFAAAIYTFLPSTIGMTSYSRYPSQQQFFTLMTAALFILAFRDDRFSPRKLYLACVGCLAIYLSWEGGIFFLPSVAVGLLLMTRPNFSWLKNRHLWAGVIVTVTLIFIQLAYRIIEQADRFAYGSGARDAGIKFMWLYPFYDPYFYIAEFFLLANHLPLTVIFILGAPLWFRRSPQCRVLGFLAATVISHLALITNLLELSNWRYVYLVFGLMIVSSSITLVMFLDYLTGLARSARVGAGAALALRHAAAVVLVGSALIFSTEFVVKLYNLPWAYSGIKTRLWALSYPSMAGVVDYLRAYRLPGDPVIAINPHVLLFLEEPADYFVQSELRLSLNLGSDPRSPIHRLSGVPTILSAAELREVLSGYPRVWLVSYGATPLSVDRDIADLITAGMQPVYEDFSATVYLFGGHTPPRRQNGQFGIETVRSPGEPR